MYLAVVEKRVDVFNFWNCHDIATPPKVKNIVDGGLMNFNIANPINIFQTLYVSCGIGASIEEAICECRFTITKYSSNDRSMEGSKVGHNLSYIVHIKLGWFDCVDETPHCLSIGDYKHVMKLLGSLGECVLNQLCVENHCDGDEFANWTIPY